jgi:hypothetical protein
MIVAGVAPSTVYITTRIYASGSPSSHNNNTPHLLSHTHTRRQHHRQHAYHIQRMPSRAASLYAPFISLTLTSRSPSTPTPRTRSSRRPRTRSQTRAARSPTSSPWSRASRMLPSLALSNSHIDHPQCRAPRRPCLDLREQRARHCREGLRGQDPVDDDG